MLARPHWGCGLATEAGRAALAYAFEVVGADRVISLIRPEDRPSIRLAERLGERYERTTDLLGAPAHVYGLTRHKEP